MATSISKSQADALAEGFDFGGSSKDELQPKNSLSALYQLAGGLAEQAAINLEKSNRISSGALVSSIKVLNPEIIGKRIQVDIQLLDYYKFIDAGVRGTKSGSSSAGYAYKDKMPPVNVIRKWILREGLKHRVDRHNITKRERHRARLHNTIQSQETSVKSVAFAIAKSIQQKGLKRTNFFSKAVSAARVKANKELGAAFKIDVISSLPKTISGK